MSLIYLASPYSHEDPAIREQRYNNVLNITKELLERGFYVYSPIVHNHNIVKLMNNRIEETAWDFWEKYDISFLRKCDTLWIFMDDGWKESKGIKEEYLVARRLHLTIACIDLFGNICPVWRDIYAKEN